MASINVKKEDIDYASNFLVQVLRDNGYEGDVSNGTAVYDLIIKPSAVIYTLYKRQI